MFGLLGQLAGFIIVVFILLYVVKISGGSNTAESRPRVEAVQACLVYGASLINDGYEYFPDWSNLMIREFDDSIRSELPRYFDVAKSIANQPRDKWPHLIAQSSQQD